MDMRISDVNPQKAELSLGEILGAANGFLYTIVNIQSLFLQNLLISNRWFSTVCLSLLTLMYP